jgi:putative MATE family efflux protein
MVPWFCGVVFLVPMVGNSAIRATGDTLTPSLIMLTAGGLNVLLDSLLIFGLGPFPRLELRGAALATILSYFVVFVSSTCLLRFRYRMLSFHRVAFRELFQSWRDVMHIALPAIGTNQMVPVANGLLTAWVARHGDAAVAAWGVGTRLESLMMSPSFALSTAMAPFAGQNFGALRPDRVMEALRFAARYCLGIGATVWLVCACGGSFIASRFSEEPQTLALIQQYLWIVPCSHGAFGLMLQITSTFNAHRRPGESAMVFASRFFLFVLPLAWVGNQFYGHKGLFAGVAAGNVLACLLALGLLRWMFRTETNAVYAP